MKFSNLEKLIEKIESVGLKRQKSLICENYSMTFYFSENIQGNKIWWWQTYKEFFNDDTPEPKNIFYYGLLVSHLTNDPEFIYAVSLGKSHFYLSKLIEADFGIKLAVRMANENTILLKKSRYFAGTKRQDISSYEKFIKNNYEAGESVEHLKIKALNKEVWGDKNIIFADSVQMDMSIEPKGLVNIFNEIETTLLDQEIINLPKLEAISDDELITKLDSALLESISTKQAHIVIEEFETFGINFCFRFNEYEYEILTLENRRSINKKYIGNSIDINNIYDYFQEFKDIGDVNKVKLRFKIDGTGVFTKPIKELLDFHIKHEDTNYFLKNGCWYSFNQTFMDYLSAALNDIQIIKKDNLNN